MNVIGFNLGIHPTKSWPFFEMQKDHHTCSKHLLLPENLRHKFNSVLLFLREH